MKVGVMGAGWYGAHLAIALTKQGYQVTIFEKNADIFSQLSSNFGVRLHAGPHYPRSEETRKSCHRSFADFSNTYPDLITPHDLSIYALGVKDADGDPSKVNVEQFEKVCHELPSCRMIDAEAHKLKNLQTAMHVDEPSIDVGKRLREKFRTYLQDANITVHCNYEVKNIEKKGNKALISNGVTEYAFDYIINATSYQALLPKQIPFDLNVVYQTCLVLIYRDTVGRSHPFSLTIMDGWYPCLMPYIDGEEPNAGFQQKYILYHSKWAIMGSFSTPAQAYNLMNEITPEFVETQIKTKSEEHMATFWPEFAGRFVYEGYKVSVLAKIKTNKEFRSAVTFAEDNIIHIVPGKVSNVFDAEKEVLALIKNEHVLNKENIHYIKDGILDTAMSEIVEKPVEASRNTCELQTFKELKESNLKPTYQKAPNPTFWKKTDTTSSDLKPASSPKPGL